METTARAALPLTNGLLYVAFGGDKHLRSSPGYTKSPAQATAQVDFFARLSARMRPVLFLLQ
jgi:hypothetical protein